MARRYPAANDSGQHGPTSRDALAWEVSPSPMPRRTAVAKKLYEDDVLVIGLGRFGGAVAIELQRLGHHVVAVERDAARAESYLGRVDKIVQADASNPQAMANLKGRGSTIAVVGIGSSV